MFVKSFPFFFSLSLLGHRRIGTGRYKTWWDKAGLMDLEAVMGISTLYFSYLPLVSFRFLLVCRYFLDMSLM